MPPRKPKQAASMILSDLEQVRVLADPLRIRILEELCTVERTTKQVAERLAEKPTKLYHHVEALERVGLIRLTRTRQNRGTLEKYYLAVARQFTTDQLLFSTAEAGAEDTLGSMVTTFFDRTAGELRGLVAQGQGKQGVEEEGVLSFMEIRTSEREGRRLQARLMKIIKSFQEEEVGREKKAEERRYRFTLAFFPLDSFRIAGRRR